METQKKFDFKKLITASNILGIILIFLYILDCYLPLPDGYTGYTNWDSESSPIFNYLFGSCGGLLSDSLAMGAILDPNGAEIYRHFTQMFLHGGILHLIANLVGLYFIGNYTEKRFGWWLTCILFVVVGFVESFITDPLYSAMLPSKAEEVASQISVGASGGIYGLMGASLAAIFFDLKSFKKIGKPTKIVSAIYGVLTTYVVGFGWSTVCHTVALILGLVIGTAIILPFYLWKKGKFAHTEQPPDESGM